MTNNQIGIFRLQLFKPSETFIQSQASQLMRYRPIYIGRRLFGDPNGNSVAIPERGGRVTQCLRLLELYGFRNPRQFLDALGGEKIDLLHAHFGIDGVFALPLAQKLGIPLVTTLHGFDVTRSESDMLRSFRPALINGVIYRPTLQRNGQLFLCVSNSIRKMAIARGYPEERLRMHYIGVDCEHLRRRDGAGEEGLIVHVARLVEKKGTTFLLRAFARLKPQFPLAKLVIIGDGHLRPALEAESQKLNCGADCQFLGMLPHSEVLRWIGRAAVTAAPSVIAANGDAEALCMVAIEAGAQGVPVVGFDSTGINEAIVAGKTGLLAPERDVTGLARNISILLEDSTLRQTMGQIARRHVAENFDIKRQTARLEDYYDDLLKDRR